MPTSMKLSVKTCTIGGGGKYLEFIYNGTVLSPLAHLVQIQETTSNRVADFLWQVFTPGNESRVTITCQMKITKTTPATTETTTQPVQQLDQVLVLYDSSKALLTNVAGDVTELDWKVEGEANSRSYCSLTFNNEMFIYGQVLTNEFSFRVSRNCQNPIKDQFIPTSNTKSAQ